MTWDNDGRATFSMGRNPFRIAAASWPGLQAWPAALLAAVQERRAAETPWRNAASASG